MVSSAPLPSRSGTVKVTAEAPSSLTAVAVRSSATSWSSAPEAATVFSLAPRALGSAREARTITELMPSAMMVMTALLTTSSTSVKAGRRAGASGLVMLLDRAGAGLTVDADGADGLAGTDLDGAGVVGAAVAVEGDLGGAVEA